MSSSAEKTDEATLATIENQSPHVSYISSFRKGILLLLFSVAQFIDICNVSEMFTAIPTMARALKYTESQSVWLVSGYQLTFASFLLMVRLMIFCHGLS
jgi:hypothetical protein